MQCGKFVPASAFFRDLARRATDLEHPRLDVEVEMRECVVNHRQSLCR
jgi:hypothetical protein